MELAGRIVTTFYNMEKIATTESLKSGIENTSGGIKAGENYQSKIENTSEGIKAEENYQP